MCGHQLMDLPMRDGSNYMVTESSWTRLDVSRLKALKFKRLKVQVPTNSVLVIINSPALSILLYTRF